MQEVSFRVVSVFADLVGTRGVPAERLTEGLPGATSIVARRRGRLDWETCCLLAERTVGLCGDWSSLEQAASDATAKGASYGPVRRVFGLCVGMQQLYWIADRWFGPSLFPHIRSELRMLPDGRIEQRLALPEPYRPCEAIFKISAVMLRAAPRLVGQPEALIDVEIKPRSAVITIKPPPSVTLWSGASRLWRVLSGTRDVLDELGSQQEQVTQSFAELRRANARISTQAEQLRTINRLGRELALHVDLPCLGRTVVMALQERAGLGAVALLVEDEPAHALRLLDAQGNREGSPTRILDLVTRERRVGCLHVWREPPVSDPNMPSLLDEMVPWIAIALHNALSFGELSRSRALLEERVKERTLELEHTARALELALEERERLDAERARFFANASHELRTPLTLLLPVLEELVAAPALAGDEREAVRRALRTSYRMARLVNDLLDLSKVEAHLLRLSPAPVDFAALLRQVLAPWQPDLAKRQVVLDTDLPVELVLALDAERIETVAWNLIGNAARHTPSHGRISVSVKELDEGVLWSVRNTGPCIPAAELERIFERFAQPSDSPMRRYGTSGLGLALVKEIVELHGGRVEAENQVDGVMFRVWLTRPDPAAVAEHPVAPFVASAEMARLFSPELTRTPSSPPAAAPEPLTRSTTADDNEKSTPVPAKGGRSPRRLLVVEDHDELRAELCRSLGRDYVMLEAADGVQGLELARRERPDLILSDVMMPELDGIGLVRALKADSDTRPIPIVLLTARSDLGTKLTGLAEGADDYVITPFHLSELRARVRGQLRLRDLTIELAQRERLATLGTVVAGVAHELRNPLNGILNTVLPLRELWTDGPSEVAQLLDLAILSARRAEELSQRLLLVARAGEGPKIRLDLLDTIGLAARMIRTPNGNGPRVELPPAEEPEPILVMGDVGALMQAWANLLDNAAKAAGPTGHVTVRMQSAADSVTVWVEDDGPGVAPEARERVFEPFFTTRVAGEGTGLGLPIVQRTVLDHGGTIELLPRQGQGACFRVTLPRVVVPRRRAPEPGQET